MPDISIPSEFISDVQKAQKAEKRYRLQGNWTALDLAANAWERIINHSIFPVSAESFQMACYCDAGRVFFYRFRVQSNPDDLKKALSFGKRAVILTHPNSPDRSGCLNEFGNTLSESYQQSGSIETLNEAISAFQEAEHLAANPNSPYVTYRPGYLTNLGLNLIYRYDHIGRLEDLEKAVRVCREAVNLTPNNSPYLSIFLHNLSLTLNVRYKRTRRLEDMEEAVHTAHKAVDLTSTNSPYRPSRLANLSSALHNRSEWTRSEEDLDEAIHAVKDAVSLTPPYATERPGMFLALGNRLYGRYKLGWVLKDKTQRLFL